MIPSSPEIAYAAYCSDARVAGRERRLPGTRTARLDFSHNDYLGLSRHPHLIAASRRAALRYGVGAGGSRLLSGDSAIAHALERRIARSKRTPRALVFSSGFVLNASVIRALLDRSVLGCDALVFCDRHVHASMYDAFAHAHLRVHRYRHADLRHLETLLHASRSEARPRFIFTESVFGMDGDRAQIAELRQLAKTYGAVLFVDEAHATGMFGPGGSGLAKGVVADGGIVMGTFSKALGGSGAYLACNEVVYRYMLQRCAGFIYSTAPSPPTSAAALAAWRLLPHCDDLRQATLRRATHVRTMLHAAGYDTGVSDTHIVPVICNSIDEAERLRDRLAERGIAVSLVRPPTVPPNAARIRIAVCATHDDDAIAELLAAFPAR